MSFLFQDKSFRMLKGQEKGSVTVLLGALWGDEGKGKIVDYLIAKNKLSFPSFVFFSKGPKNV